MSANLDLVRSIYSAWKRGDFASTNWVHPEMELVIAGGPTPGSLERADRTGRGQARASGCLEGLRVLAQEFRELDDERILVLLHNSGRGKMSGVDLHQMRAEPTCSTSGTAT